MNELEELLKVELQMVSRMARWQRLYHKHIASFFNRSLYWKGLATLGVRGADGCF